MDAKKEYERLYQLKKQYGFTVPIMKDYEQYGLEYTDAKRGKLNINNSLFNGVKDYKSQHVTTKKIVKGKYVPFDSRTNKVFDAKEAKKYIESKNLEAQEAHFLEVYGTKTPEKDMQYLNKKIRNDARIKAGSNPLKITRDSTPIEGEPGQTVYSKKNQLRINKLNNEVLKAKEGTSYEAKDNAQLEYKINESVKNQEEEPINLKDVSATSGYVDMRRKQLEIDKQFNTADGVTY